MKRIFGIALIALVPGLVSAQFRAQTKPVNFVSLLNAPAQFQQAAMGILGLDPSRLHIYQSYQMNYVSLGKTGFTQGTYLNTMTYDFSFPLSVAVQWGINHQPFSSSQSPYVQNGLFLSAAQVRYQPTKNFLVQFDFIQNPYRYNQNPYNFYPNYRGW